MLKTIAIMAKGRAETTSTKCCRSTKKYIYILVRQGLGKVKNFKMALGQK